MAAQLGSAFGRIDLDLAPLRQAVGQARQATDAIGQAFGSLGGTIQRSAGQIAGAMDRVKNTINLQQRQYQILQQEVETTGQKYGVASLQAQKKQLALDRLLTSIEQNKQKLADLDRELDEVARGLATAGSGAEAAGSRFTRAGVEIGQFRDGLERASQQLTQTGAVLSAGVTAPLALAGKAALDAAASYETATNLFQANTGAAEADMAHFRETAKGLGADLALPGASAGDAGEVMLELAKAGLSVDEALGEARGAMQLAATEALGNAEAATIAAGAYNTFRAEGLKVSQVADILAAGANAGGESVRTLSQGIQQAGSSFAAAHVPFRDLVTQLSLMEKAGIKGSDAGTSLKTMLQRLQAPTKDARAELERLNVAVYDQQGRMRPMRELVDQVSTALGGLTQQERDRAIVTIFGSDAQRAANIVLAGGVVQYDAMAEAVGRQGAAQDLAAARMQGVAGAIEGFKSSAVSTVLEAVEPFLSGITSLITQGSALIGGFMALDPAVRTAAVAFGAALAAAGPLLLALGALGGALAAINAPLALAAIGGAALIGAWTGNLGGFRDAVNALGGLGPVLAGVSVATGAYVLMTRAQLIPAIYAQVQAWAASRLAMLAAAGPYAIAAAAIGGVAVASARLRDELERGGDRVTRQAPGWQQASQALERYNARQAEGTTRARQLTEHLEALRAGQEEVAKRAAWRGAFGLNIEGDMATLRNYQARIVETSQILDAEVAANERWAAEAEASAQRATAAQRLAAGDIAGALDAQRQAANLTEDEYKALEKAAAAAANEGASAFGAAVHAEVGFLGERRAAQATHTAAMQSLAAELAAATTDAERQAIRDRQAAAEAAYADAERQAAEAYARAQAAQLAHLGQMLIDYVTAQAQMAGISQAQIAEITGALAAEYGVQQSLVDRAYGDMLGSLDAWVARNGEGTDQVIANQQRIRDDTVALQQEVDRQIALMTEQAKADLDAGKLDWDQYAERLRRIPGEAELAAAALLQIPTRIESTVTVTTVRREVGGQASGDVSTRSPTGAGRPGASGTRARGGPVGAGQLYEVAEAGRPELLVSGGRTYLMMGAEAGTVLPALSSAGAALGALAPAARALAAAGATGGMPAGPALGGGTVFAPQITITNPVVDNEQRLHALAETIVSRARALAESAFGQGVDTLLLGQGVA